MSLVLCAVATWTGSMDLCQSKRIGDKTFVACRTPNVVDYASRLDDTDVRIDVVHYLPFGVNRNEAKAACAARGMTLAEPSDDELPEISRLFQLSFGCEKEASGDPRKRPFRTFVWAAGALKDNGALEPCNLENTRTSGRAKQRIGGYLCQRSTCCTCSG